MNLTDNILCLTFALAILPTASQAADNSPVPRPNILFIFSDAHAEHAVSTSGSKVNHTPNIDRLAAEGARFSNSVVTISTGLGDRILMKGTFITSSFRNESASEP